MQGPLDAGAVVATELADVRDDVREVLRGHLALRQHLLTSHEACFRETTEIHHDLEEALESVQRAHALREIGWKSPEQRLELVALLHSTIEHIDLSFGPARLCRPGPCLRQRPSAPPPARGPALRRGWQALSRKAWPLPRRGSPRTTVRARHAPRTNGPAT